MKVCLFRITLILGAVIRGSVSTVVTSSSDPQDLIGTEGIEALLESTTVSSNETLTEEGPASPMSDNRGTAQRHERASDSEWTNLE